MSDWYDETFQDNVRFGLRVSRTLHAEQSAFHPEEGKVLAG